MNNQGNFCLLFERNKAAFQISFKYSGRIIFSPEALRKYRSETMKKTEKSCEISVLLARLTRYFRFHAVRRQARNGEISTANKIWESVRCAKIKFAVPLVFSHNYWTVFENFYESTILGLKRVEWAMLHLFWALVIALGLQMSPAVEKWSFLAIIPW